MKLKNVLRLAFFMLTLIPIVIVSLLLYKSGFDLSKESYTNNLIESVNIQANSISQTIENGMVSDYRFAKKIVSEKASLKDSFQSYLEVSEDKISTAILLDEENVPIYTIGEKGVIDKVLAQLPTLSNNTEQSIKQFALGKDKASLGVMTPVWENDTYIGSMVSIYNESYLLKMLSNYYEITNTHTYICNENGDVVSFKGASNGESDQIIEGLKNHTFQTEGNLDVKVKSGKVSGYYKNIYNSPWYLVGIIDDGVIYNFTNKFIYVYIAIILVVFLADIVLAFYFTNKVVKPINGLIHIMDEYQNNLNQQLIETVENDGYYETRYLRKKFFSLMKTIMLVQHNFQGIYQLYQTSNTGDIDVDIDVMAQSIHCNHSEFEHLFHTVEIDEGDCIVENFIKCFSKEDQNILRTTFENMRDEHLSVARDMEVSTPYLNKKWFHLFVVPLYENDRLCRLFVQLRDVSSFKKAELESKDQARRDQLTGLYNRLGLLDYVKNMMNTEEKVFHHAVLFIDMDYFKMVNDYLGHNEGDKLLCNIALILAEEIGTHGIASRLGGDEFIVLLVHTSKDIVEQIQKNIKNRLVYHFESKEHAFKISASIGCANWTQESECSFEEILNQADASMYESKRKLKHGKQKND